MKIIKIIVVLIIAFLGGLCLLNAQDRISITALHDVKLGLGLDTKHNNGKSVLNGIIAVNLEGKQFEYYYFSLQPFYEYANLQDSNFHRYGINTQWHFNRLIIDNLTVSPAIGFAFISREGFGYGSYQFLVDLSYPILKDLEVVSRSEFVRRSDLLTPKTVYNLSIGLKYKI